LIVRPPNHISVFHAHSDFLSKRATQTRGLFLALDHTAREWDCMPSIPFYKRTLEVFGPILKKSFYFWIQIWGL
jgi:hypothetical protein